MELTLEQKLDFVKKKVEIQLSNRTKKHKANRLRLYRKMLENGKGKTRHHVWPQSRYKDRPSNIVYLDANIHRLYHELFTDKNPDEILEFLVGTCWGGDNSSIIKYAEKRNTNQ